MTDSPRSTLFVWSLGIFGTLACSPGQDTSSPPPNSGVRDGSVVSAANTPSDDAEQERDGPSSAEATVSEVKAIADVINEDANALNPAMRHRGYLGWIGDLRRANLTGVAWPSMTIDDTLTSDYLDTLDALARNGQNEITLWGFFTNDNWLTDVPATIDVSRGVQIRAFIEAAHTRSIRILSGVGVYSWGFANIIAAHPEVRCASNPRVMSLASSAAWDWQKQVIDFILSFPFDGVSLQSADLGRCTDGALSQQSDQSYHADLNAKAAEYVKGKDPRLLVGIAGWGMDFGVASAMPDYVRMAKSVDYIIDVGSSALRPGRSYRKGLVQNLLPAAFGTIGSPNVEPIQHYPRDRYFVPTLMRPAQAMADAFEDGARGMETYARTRGNVGDEVSMELLGELESIGFGDPKAALRGVLARLYEPMTDAALDALVLLFLDGESAFFAAASSSDIILLGPRDLPSFDLRRSIFASWSHNLQVVYRDVLSSLLDRAETLAPSLKNQAMATALVSTLRNAVADMTTLSGTAM